MNVLITGGAGFIGYHLARYHADQGDSVVILDNFSLTDGTPDEPLQELLSRPNIVSHRTDLTETISFDYNPGSLDVVYHLAAINGTRLFYEIPYPIARTHLLMTLNLLDWIEENRPGRLIYASTSEVYAGCDEVGLLTIPTDESTPVVFPQPTNVRFSYATSKFMGEFLCLQFGKEFDVGTSVVRYHNIYGPRMGINHVVPEFLARIRRREDPFRMFGGDETRAFCYVDDAVRATYLVAASRDCHDEVIHVGNPHEEIKIEELAKLMLDQMGERFELQECGGRGGSVSRRCPDISKLQRLTGYAPQVSLRDGLERTRDWYISRQLV